MIFVPDTDQKWFHPTLRAMVWACEQLGHETTLFTDRDKIRGRKASHVILWGSNVDDNLKRVCWDTGATIIYLESGWLLDRYEGSIQLDLAGVGGRASWVDEPLTYTPGPSLQPNDQERLLVILRYDTGGKKPDGWSEVCPLFPTNLAWVEHLVASRPPMPVCLRPHYLTEDRFNQPLQQIAHKIGWQWDDSGEDFVSAAKKSKAVAVLDSTAGSCALELGLPVFAFARQVYCHPGVVYLATMDSEVTHQRLDDLNKGACDLDVGAIQAMINKIRQRQWYPADREDWPARMRREFGV